LKFRFLFAIKEPGARLIAEISLSLPFELWDVCDLVQKLLKFLKLEGRDLVHCPRAIALVPH
jgi:hypothetical protein